MKKIIILFVAIVFSVILYAQEDKMIEQPEVLEEEAVPQSDVFQVVEIMPYYLDCTNENIKEQNNCTKNKVRNIVFKSVRYPELARDQNMQGKVFVKFVINTEGDVENIQIARSPHKMFNQTVIDAVKKLPKFEPGIQDGKKVKVQYMLPVTFRLS